LFVASNCIIISAQPNVDLEFQVAVKPKNVQL